MRTLSGRGGVVTWAPVGWVPGDPGFDEAPFGSVLGDPLMGSPLFDVAVLDDPFEHRLEDRKSARGGRAASAEGAQSDPAAVLRAQAEERVQVVRRGVPRGRRAAPRSSGYGRAPGVGLGAAASGRRSRGARQPVRPVRQSAPVTAPAPVPQSSYGRRPGPPGGYGGGYGGRPGQPMGYGGGPGGPMGYGGAPGAPGQPAGSGLPGRRVGSGRVAPVGADPYALPGVDGRPGRARPSQSVGHGRNKGVGPYVGWIIFFLFLVIWHIVR